jgi:hypothetical protein
MAVVNARTDILTLIMNKDSSVDDLKKLYEIAPEKFSLKIPGPPGSKEDEHTTLLEYAILINRTDLADYLRSLNIYKIPKNSIESKNLVKKINEIINSTKRNEFIVNEIKDTIKNVDLSKIEIKYLKEIVDTIINHFINDITNRNNLLFALVDNPKGGIDINLKYDFKYKLPLFFILFQVITNKTAKYILDKYKPDIKNILPNETPFLYYVITHRNTDTIYSASEKYNVIKTVLEYGLEHGITIHDTMIKGTTKHNYISYIYSFATPVIKENLYKLFIEHGANIDSPLNEENYTLLIESILDGNIPLIDSCLENGANVNHITTDNATPIAAVLLSNKRNTIKKLIEKLIEKGADVNIPAGPNKFSPLRFAISSTVKLPLDIIKLLLDSGVNKDYKSPVENLTALEYSIKEYNTDKEYYKQVIELLGGKIPGEEVKWKGFSRGDIEKFDIFFEKPFDWSCCPVCLEYVERSDGCMYMSHDCATTKHFYHKKLYDTFVFEYHRSKQIEWCTVCGRITQLHKHLVLSSAQKPLKELAALKPEIQALLDRGDNVAFFDNANCLGFGGGGTEEKAARFRRMREYALELQDDVNKKKLNEAMEELIEEVWNAPLVRNKKIKKILEDKKWNINVKEFPENKKNTRNKNNNTNATNLPFNGVKPTIINDDCIIMGEDELTNTRETNPKYQFHHETIGGIDHDGVYICQKDLAKAIEIKNTEFGLDTFGKCWWHYECNANLHPEELKGIIPEVLYEEYRKKYNKKMKQKGGTRKLKKQTMRGGNPTSMLHELDDGTCTPHKWTRDGKVRKL